MAENPLLPNAELRALLGMVRRAAEAERNSLATHSAVSSDREALLAATLLQLKPEDLLYPKPGDTAVQALAPRVGKPRSAEGGLQVKVLPEGTSHLLLAASLAAALKRSGHGGLVLTFADQGVADPHWAEALRWAQEDRLPLVLALADPRGTGAFLASGETSGTHRVSWGPVQQIASESQLPVLAVDGQDAVAVYRAMQESALRARAGNGPAVLWAMLPSSQKSREKTPSAPSPVSRLEDYLRVRRIRFAPARQAAS